jgi:hypothetical protein
VYKVALLIIYATSVIFLKTTQSKQSPDVRESAQSGHPVDRYKRGLVNCFSPLSVPVRHLAAAIRHFVEIVLCFKSGVARFFLFTCQKGELYTKVPQTYQMAIHYNKLS